MKTLLTNQFKQQQIEQFIKSIDGEANSIYYVTAGALFDVDPDVIPTPNNSVKSLTSDIYQNMLFGKHVTKEDVLPMILKHEWVEGTVFDIYDDNDPDLMSKKYYTVINEGTFHHVFKCISNNNGAPSTIPPSFADISQELNAWEVSDGYYGTSDGYQWKYMFGVSNFTMDKFGTAKYMPVVVNKDVKENAVNGTIDHIKVIDGGATYDNYISGMFNGPDIGVISIADPNPARNYVISPTASAVNGFYTGCTLHIVDGSAKGQHRVITNYVNDGSRKIVALESPIDGVSSTSEYEISPTVEVVGNGSTKCKARAIINPVGNTVESVLILDRGQNYSWADATIKYNPVVPVTSHASLRPIVSPPGGHGYNPIRELNANYLGISVQFANNEGNTIIADSSFRTTSILKDPLFQNVRVDCRRVSDGTIGFDGNFSINEPVCQIQTVRIEGNVSVTINSPTINSNGVLFEESLYPGSLLLIKSDNDYFIGNTISIANDSQLVLSSNSPFTNSSCEVYLAKSISSGTVSDIQVGFIRLTNVKGFFQTGRKIIGLRSYAVANADAVIINNIYRDGVVSTINQMIHYTGTMNSGTFIDGEVVYQGDGSTSNAHFHSTIDNVGSTEFYISNLKGEFVPGVPIIGQTSGASFTPSFVYAGDLVPNSGEVIYIQNHVPIHRSNTSSEIIKTIVGF